MKADVNVNPCIQKEIKQRVNTAVSLARHQQVSNLIDVCHSEWTGWEIVDLPSLYFH